jgi:transcriptional regulator with XRE-family HTH domain
MMVGEAKIGARGYGFKAGALRSRRIRLRLTQRDLAERVGISTSQVSRLEVGTHIPHFKTIERIAGAVGLDPDALIDYGDDEPSPDSAAEPAKSVDRDDAADAGWEPGGWGGPGSTLIPPFVSHPSG